MARAMKDSGIEWIGEIPEGWMVSKLQYFIDCYDGRRVPVDAAERTPGPYPYWGAGSIMDYVNDYLFDEELLLLGEDGAPFFDYTRPVAFYSNEKIWVNNHIHVLKPHADICIKYLLHYLNNVDYKSYINGSILNKLTQSNMNKIALLLPPVSEQQIIADYLDTECAKIDAVIEQTRASIEEYKKLKQSVITQSVTKGIRPGRRMVNSGVDWIGQIPDEWAVFRIANLYDERNERGTDDLPILTVSINTGISDHEIPDEEKDRVVVRSEDRTLYKRVCPGDLVYNMMRAWQGAFGAARVDGMVSPAYVVAKPKTPGILDSRYIEALLRTPAAIEEMHRYSRGITDFRLRLYWPEFKNICVCVPSVKEQIEIADYIDAKAAEIDALIQKKQQFLVELESYKKALIFEYVTGKKEVPHQQETLSIKFIDMRALLMCRIIELMKPKGRIHLLKALYAIDCLSGLNNQTQYVRYTHGPYDTRIEEYETAMAKHGWAFSNRGAAVEYRRGKTFAEYRGLYQRCFHDLDPLVRKICSFLKPMKTSQAERVATLLAVWNDFLLDGATPTDKEIVQEVRSHWTPNKAHSEEATWFDTLRKIKDNNLVPRGIGLHTAPKTEKYRRDMS